MLTSPTSTKGEIVSSNNQMSENIDKQLTKAHLRYTALTRFEDDCPQQLFVDRSIQDRKEAKMKAKEKEEKEREKEREKADEREEAKAKAEEEQRAKMWALESKELKEKGEKSSRGETR